MGCQQEYLKIYYFGKFYGGDHAVFKLMQGIGIKAQCTIFQNNLQINCKKKSKLSSVQIDPKSKLLIVTGKGEHQTFRFPIQKLKTIHRKFIDEGKITIEIDSQVIGTILKGVQVVNEKIKCEGNFQILVNNACKENLQLLINQLVTLRKQNHSKQDKQQNENEKYDRPKKHLPKEISRLDIEENNPKKFGRKHLFGQASGGELIKSKSSVEKQCNLQNLKKNNPLITLSDLPKILLQQIIQFSGVSLSYRLISREIQQIVLRNIRIIKFKEQVDEQAFNKLGRWALFIEAKAKFVKTIKLSDRFEDQILQKGKAKTLKFGNWKQLSAKHITQLKGLRIYCLEIPYLIKFDLSNIFGIRLVELRLKGKGANVHNALVKDDDILYIINNMKDLKVIEVAYSSTKVLCNIKNPEKMLQIHIGVLNRIGSDHWTNFAKFTNLKILAIEKTHKLGINESNDSESHEASFPENLEVLEMGLNISPSSKASITANLRSLRLLGQHFKNSTMRDFYFPLLKNLDIVNCPNLTPECLQNMRNLRVITNWNRNMVDNANEFYKDVHISIISVKGYSYC